MKHTEEAKAKISATRLQRYGCSPEEKKRKAKERYARWVAANQERSKAIKRKHYEANREAINAAQREANKTEERKAFMREYAPKHRAANKEKYRTYDQNRRSAEVGAAGSHTNEQWLEKLAGHRGCCAYCNADGKMTRDHDVPLARGGSNDIGNILPACARCNSRKGTLTGDEYRARLLGKGQSQDQRWAEQLARARA